MKRTSRPSSWSGRSRNSHRHNGNDKKRSIGSAGSENTYHSSVVDSDDPLTSQQQQVIIDQMMKTKNSASKKDYSHVPCKFFLQGNCHAGNACPFSHDLSGSSSDQVCKYFLKGNCKFGMKCANAHILPDGTRLNPRRTSVSNNSAGKKNSMTKRRGSKCKPESDFAAPVEAQKYQKPLAVNSTPVLNTAASFSYNFEQTSPLAYNNYQMPHAVQNSPYSSQDHMAGYANSYQFGTFQHSYAGSTLGSSELQTPNSYSSSTELQLEETLLPNELTDLLTPNEFRRRESYKMLNTTARPQTNPFSAPLTEPRLSFSSSSSSSDIGWRNMPSSSQNIDYWQNLEQVENNLYTLKIDEKDEDKLNQFSMWQQPAQISQEYTSNGTDSSESGLAIDTFHGGIY